MTMNRVPKKIRLEREQKRLEREAQKRGYDSFAEMLYDMYVVQQTPLKKLVELLYTPMWTLRKKFDELGIELRGRGGRNNVAYEITPELIQEVTRDGTTAVADRLGVDRAILALRLQAWAKQQEQK